MSSPATIRRLNALALFQTFAEARITAEQQFLAQALKVYRSTNSDGRKKLRQWLKDAGSA